MTYVGNPSNLVFLDCQCFDDSDDCLSLRPCPTQDSAISKPKRVPRFKYSTCLDLPSFFREIVRFSWQKHWTNAPSTVPGCLISRTDEKRQPLLKSRSAAARKQKRSLFTHPRLLFFLLFALYVEARFIEPSDREVLLQEC